MADFSDQNLDTGAVPGVANQTPSAPAAPAPVVTPAPFDSVRDQGKTPSATTALGSPVNAGLGTSGAVPPPAPAASMAPGAAKVDPNEAVKKNLFNALVIVAGGVLRRVFQVPAKFENPNYSIGMLPNFNMILNSK